MTASAPPSASEGDGAAPHAPAGSLAISPRTSRLARWARALHPASPLFAKEVTSAGRRLGTYITRGVYTLLMLGLVTIAYFASTANLRVMQGAAWIQSVQALAPNVVMSILWFQFVLLSLLACVLTAPAFCDERRRGTLGALFTTPLSSFQLCLGKLAGHMVQIVILVAIAAPVLLAIRVFGGVEVGLILVGLGLVLTTALFGACLAMLFSVFVPRAVSAASVAVVTLALFQGLPPLALYILQSRGFLTTRLDLYPMISPTAAMGMLTASSAGTPIGTFFNLVATGLGAMGVNLGLSVLAFWAAVASVRRAMREDAGERRKTPKKVKVRSARRGGTKEAVGVASAGTTAADGLAADKFVTPDGADASAEAPDGPAGDVAGAIRRRKLRVRHAPSEGDADLGDAPVRWRELRQPILNASWLVRAIIAVFVLTGLCWGHYEAHSSNLHGAVQMIAAIAGCILAVFLAAVNTAGGLAQERESRTLETLLTTPLSAREILMGKFWGACRRQALIPAVVVVHMLLGSALFGEFDAIAAVHAALILCPALAFLCATGTLASVLFRKGSAAAIANFLLAGALWAGLPIFWAMIGNISDLPANKTIFEKGLLGVFSINPVAMMGVTVVGASQDRAFGNGSVGYDLWDLGKVEVGAFTLMTLGSAVVYGLAAAGLLWVSAKIFAARTHRGVSVRTGSELASA